MTTYQDIHELAREKGWWEGTFRPMTAETVASKLALIHSEVSEALECVRGGPIAMVTMDAADGKPIGFPSELADIVIRVADLAGAMSINLQAEIDRKHAFNKTRSHRHGGKTL